MKDWQREYKISDLEQRAAREARMAAQYSGGAIGDEMERQLRETNAQLEALGVTPEYPLAAGEHFGLRFLAR